MANWQRKLDIKEVWKTDDAKLIAYEIAKQLEALAPLEDEYLDNQRQDFAEQFEDLSKDLETDNDDFNYVMSKLYDWGDTSLDGKWNGQKVCWIGTI